ncbi:D-glycero-alpha-D-manno-heptose-1,7-bisphosphate 7-phosphatase [Nitrospira sp. M1]
MKHRGITVFVDRDGTLNEDPGYLSNPDALVLYPGVVEAVAKLKQAECAVVLVTNQSGIGRGYLTRVDLLAIHDKLERLLEQGGGSLDGVFFCPHLPDAGCECRKPKPGLIHQAVESLQVSVARSYMVGDKRSDMELASNVGAIGVLVNTSPVSQDAIDAKKRGELSIECITLTFREAVEWILRDTQTRQWSVE